MSETNLFGEAIAQDESKSKTTRPAKPGGPAKLLRAQRNQVLLTPTDLEALLPEDHVARGMWQLVGKLDLTRFLSEIESREQEVAASAGEGQSEVQAAARKRAAQERLDRIQRAIEELPKAQAAQKSPEEREEARVSTTDPEARVMKMGDGGFRPAWNVQLGSDTRSRIIAGVSVDNRGSDRGDLSPMLAQIQTRTGLTPDEYLADGGYVDHDDISALAAKGVTPYIPLNRKKDKAVDPHLPKPGDPPVIAEWRARMASEEAKRIYKDRAATAESINADLKCFRGLDRFLVRSLPKVTCVVFWSAIAYNMLKLLATT